MILLKVSGEVASIVGVGEIIYGNTRKGRLASTHGAGVSERAILLFYVMIFNTPSKGLGVVGSIAYAKICYGL